MIRFAISGVISRYRVSVSFVSVKSFAFKSKEKSSANTGKHLWQFSLKILWQFCGSSWSIWLIAGVWFAFFVSSQSCNPCRSAEAELKRPPSVWSWYPAPSRVIVTGSMELFRQESAFRYSIPRLLFGESRILLICSGIQDKDLCWFNYSIKASFLAAGNVFPFLKCFWRRTL